MGDTAIQVEIDRGYGYTGEDRRGIRLYKIDRGYGYIHRDRRGIQLYRWG